MKFNQNKKSLCSSSLQKHCKWNVLVDSAKEKRQENSKLIPARIQKHQKGKFLFFGRSNYSFLIIHDYNQFINYYYIN